MLYLYTLFLAIAALGIILKSQSRLVFWVSFAMFVVACFFNGFAR